MGHCHHIAPAAPLGHIDNDETYFINAQKQHGEKIHAAVKNRYQQQQRQTADKHNGVIADDKFQCKQEKGDEKDKQQHEKHIQ